MEGGKKRNGKWNVEDFGLRWQSVAAATLPAP